MGKELYQVQGVDRLKLWLEYTQLHDKDPEQQVNHCEPFSCARAIHANPWLHQDWMTSCVPFLKLHSWSLDNPKHPRVVFNVRNKLSHSEMRSCLLSCLCSSPHGVRQRLPSSRHQDELIRCDAVYYPAQ